MNRGNTSSATFGFLLRPILVRVLLHVILLFFVQMDYYNAEG